MIRGRYSGSCVTHVQRYAGLDLTLGICPGCCPNYVLHHFAILAVPTACLSCGVKLHGAFGGDTAYVDMSRY